MQICRNIRSGHFRPRKEHVQEDLHGKHIGNCSIFMVCTKKKQSAIRLAGLVKKCELVSNIGK